MSFTLIESKTLGTAAASIEFTSIPQDGTDLMVLFSTRSVVDNAFITWTGFSVTASGSGGGYSGRMLEGNGATVDSATQAGTNFWDYGASPDSATTANTFGNGQIYIPNYSAGGNKSYSMDRVTENNATQASQLLYAGLWANGGLAFGPTAAVTSLTFTGLAGNFAIGSTISLYKITKGSSGGVVVS
jgi:hypothetical protein